MEILLDLSALLIMYMMIRIRFYKNFARHSDQFRWDFCWTGLVFYAFGPRCSSYFEDCSLYQGSVMHNLDVFVVIIKNELFNNQSGCGWFERPWCSYGVTVKLNRMDYNRDYHHFLSLHLYHLIVSIARNMKQLFTITRTMLPYWKIEQMNGRRCLSQWHQLLHCYYTCACNMFCSFSMNVKYWWYGTELASLWDILTHWPWESSDFKRHIRGKNLELSYEIALRWITRSAGMNDD